MSIAYMQLYLDYTHIYYARCEGPDNAVYVWMKAMCDIGYEYIDGTL